MIHYRAPKASKHFVKANSVTEAIKLQKCCRPLLNLLIFSGINLVGDRLLINFAIWLIRLILFCAAIYNFSFQIYNVTNGLAGDDLWILNFNEHFPMFAFLYIICLRGAQIEKFTVKTAKQCVLLKLNNNVYAKIRYLSWLLSICAIMVISDSPFFTYYQAVSASDCESRFASIYFGISTTSTNREIVSAISEIAYCLICLAVELYGSLLVLIIYTISACYQNVNANFNQLTDISLKTIDNFQEQHYALNKMTGEFNQLFSPAILVLFCSHTAQLIGTTGYMKSQQHLLSTLFTQPFYVSAILWCNAILPIIRVAYILLLIIIMAHKLHKQQCTKTNLFLAQWSSSPTAITANELFTLDYPLIGVALSIMITYWAFLGDIKNDLATPVATNTTCLV